MPAFYLDTSALLKRYKDEPGSAIVADLFNRQTNDRILTSTFTVLEICGVAARTRKGGFLSRRAYESLIAKLDGDVLLAFDLRQVAESTVARALPLALTPALKAGDAIQLASALMTRAEGEQEDIVFVAGDKNLLTAAEIEGLETLDPEDPAALAALRLLRGA